MTTRDPKPTPGRAAFAGAVTRVPATAVPADQLVYVRRDGYVIAAQAPPNVVLEEAEVTAIRGLAALGLEGVTYADTSGGRPAFTLGTNADHPHGRCCYIATDHLPAAASWCLERIA